MSPVEHELAAIKTQLETTNDVVARLADVVEHVALSHEALLRAINAPAATSDDEVEMALRELVATARRHTALLQLLCASKDA